MSKKNKKQHKNETKTHGGSTVDIYRNETETKNLKPKDLSSPVTELKLNWIADSHQSD